MAHQSDLIATNIEEYLHQHEYKELLRFITCGSVDDGKSTLIGRLLHDSKLIFEDHMAALEKDSEKIGTQEGELDFALLVDGLQSEREQGITIDVAYRFFSTDKRKFIIADTPGHEQYTRNMATGASTANLAIILIDARKGVLTQTKRHSYIVNLLGIKHIVVAVNKMDLVEYEQRRFEEIKTQYLEFADKLGIGEITFIPMSALKGDNVVDKSSAMPWYEGEPLISTLENIEINRDINQNDLRFPIQYVNRPSSDFRGYAGTLAAGTVKVGDSISVLPSHKSSRIKSIKTYDGDLEFAFAPMAITLELEDEIDISRGDMIVHSDNIPEIGDSLDVVLVWMHETPMQPGKTYDIKRATTLFQGHFEAIYYQVDINTLDKNEVSSLALNEIALCHLHVQREIAFDDYGMIPGTGSFIVIDRMTNMTVGAGMIQKSAAIPVKTPRVFSEFELELNQLIRKHFPHWEAKDLLELMKQ